MSDSARVLPTTRTMLNKVAEVTVYFWVSNVLCAAVFAVWFARERTLSIHTIVTTPREAFYWLAVLVTFAVDTAAGDWTVELTGWSPGTSVLLPAGLIAADVVAWRLGAGPVLTSVVFLGAILATVVYLTVTHADQTELAHHERADA